MAIISSVDDVLAAISYKVKVYNDVLKDPVAKQILSSSPPAPRKQYLSRSLDIAESKMTAAAAAASGKDKDEAAQLELERKKKAAQEEAKKQSLKTVKFEATEEEDEGGFEFEPLPVKQESNQATSMLAELIKSLPMPKTKKESAQVMRSEKVSVKVFFPDGPPLAVEAPQKGTVGELIWLTIQQHEEAKREPSLVQLTRAYLLKMAEEDGTPEDMILKYTDKFFNFGLFFYLIPNPAYDPKGTGTVRQPLSRTSEASGDRPNSKNEKTSSGTMRKGMGTFRGGKGRPSIASHNEEIESELLKVKMPDGSHTTVRLQDSDDATQVLEKCCSKRKFDPDQFHLEFIEDQEEVPSSITVQQLKSRAIELVANSAVAGLDTYMSDTKAMQYEVFKVVKIKAGFNAKKQERLLGIDFDRISNQVPEETLRNKGGFAKTVDVIRGRGEGVKNDYWLMSDLVEAFQDGEKSKQFVISFKDATNREKNLTYRYEAETPKLAKQIVGKLNRLYELNNKMTY